MGKFALIAHPTDLDLFRSYIDYLKPGKTFSDALLLKLFEWTPPYKIMDLHRISLDAVNYVDGIMIMVPFLPEMKDIKLQRVVEKVEQAIAIAAKEGCTVAALGAFTSIVVQGKEEMLGKRYNITLTSGNTLTAALIIESILELTTLFHLPLQDQTLAIIGASGDIGSGCMDYFCDKVKRIYATARGLPYLQQLCKKHESHKTCEFVITADNMPAVAGSTIVIMVTSAFTTLFSQDDFAPYSIVCDASAPVNVKISAHRRPDVFIYHGGIGSLPVSIDPGFDIGLASPFTMYGCQIEGMLLSQMPTLPASQGRGNINRSSIERYRAHMKALKTAVPAYSLGAHSYTSHEMQAYASYFLHKNT